MKGVLVPLDPTAGAQRRYRSLQCTSCHALGERYGLAYRLFAGPDVVVYHALADALAGGSAPLSFRSCVVAPGVTRLPVHRVTERTHIATAFAVWMGIEKLADDVADEGSWLKWLAVRAFDRGRREALQTLKQAAFPVQAIRDALDRQHQLERDGTVSLDAALEPTRSIAALSFGALGNEQGADDLGEKIGARVGEVLFWLDNALDLPQDLRLGRYNALARAFSLTPASSYQALHDAREHAIERARLALTALEPLLVLLPGRVAAELVEAALLAGLRTQLSALENLAGAEWQQACTSDLQTWRPPLSQVLVGRLPRAAEQLRNQTSRLWFRWTFRARATASLLAAWAFPQRAWSQQWWPEEPPPVDTAEPPPEITIDGVELDQFQEGSDRPCDILCGSFGTCDLETVCGDCCEVDCA